ncbi:MAG TPA: hypothetical protein H9829_00395 [Candidatus Tetragenococcus pullicola]|nr:hypothetical protein [Candidatus Tetragenococcus pullicola]
MIPLLLSIVAISLLALGAMLVFRQSIFFTMIQENTANQLFLRIFGFLHLFLGLCAVIIGFLNNRNLALLFLALMLIISGVFSFLLVGKMKQK